MRAATFFAMLFSSLQFTQEPAVAAETFKLLNDFNASEHPEGIYLCREVNNVWQDYLTLKDEDDEWQKKRHARKIDSITKYLGGGKQVWLRDFPVIESWQPRVKAIDYVNYRGLDIDAFSKSHNRKGVYLFSQPLFNQSRDKAILYVWYLAAHNVVLDNYYYCEKTDGTWKKKSLVLIGGFR